jgi:hypothetical protein
VVHLVESVHGARVQQSVRKVETSLSANRHHRDLEQRLQRRRNLSDSASMSFIDDQLNEHMLVREGVLLAGRRATNHKVGECDDARVELENVFQRTPLQRTVLFSVLLQRRMA